MICYTEKELSFLMWFWTEVKTLLTLWLSVRSLCISGSSLEGSRRKPCAHAAASSELTLSTRLMLLVAARKVTVSSSLWNAQTLERVCEPHHHYTDRLLNEFNFLKVYFSTWENFLFQNRNNLNKNLSLLNTLWNSHLCKCWQPWLDLGAILRAFSGV